MYFTFRKHAGKQARTVRPAVDIVFTWKNESDLLAAVLSETKTFRTSFPPGLQNPKSLEPDCR